MTEQTDILEKLKRPFHPSQVTWVASDFNFKDQHKALAAPSASVLAYHNRLDEVCGMNWSVTYTPWGERIVCHLTINGVTRSASGENGDHDNAEATAFKRTCAMFGLGRYLLNIPTAWVEYDLSAQQFAEKAKAKLEGIIVMHYRRTMRTEQEV